MRTGGKSRRTFVSDYFSRFNLRANSQKLKSAHVPVYADKVVRRVFNGYPIAPTVVFAVGYYLSIANGLDGSAVANLNIHAVVDFPAVSSPPGIRRPAIYLGYVVVVLRPTEKIGSFLR